MASPNTSKASAPHSVLRMPTATSEPLVMAPSRMEMPATQMEVTEDRIRERAYQIYVSGEMRDDPVAIWCRAERELKGI